MDPDPPDSYYFHSLDPDPHQMIRIRIQQNLFKTENKFLLRTEILFCMDQICVIFFFIESDSLVMKTHNAREMRVFHQNFTIILVLNPFCLDLDPDP